MEKEKIEGNEKYYCQHMFDVYGKDIYCEKAANKRLCKQLRCNKNGLKNGKRTVTPEKEKKLESMPLDTLADRLTYLMDRKEQPLSGKEIASRLYVSDKLVSAWRKGTRIPNERQKRDLEYILEIPQGVLDGKHPTYLARTVEEYRRAIEEEGKETEEIKKGLSVLKERKKAEYLNSFIPPLSSRKALIKNLLDLAASIRLDLEIHPDGRRVMISFPDAGEEGEEINDFLTEWKEKRETAALIGYTDFDEWRSNLIASATIDADRVEWFDTESQPNVVDALPVWREQMEIDATLPPSFEYVEPKGSGIPKKHNKSFSV